MNEVTSLDALASTTHFHIFTWVVGIILFLVAAVMADGTKGRKITHMIARLFYVLILISGVLLFVKYSSADAALYGVKFLLGLLTIGMMEMVLVRSEKEKAWALYGSCFSFSYSLQCSSDSNCQLASVGSCNRLTKNVTPTGSCCQWAFFCNQRLNGVGMENRCMDAFSKGHSLFSSIFEVYCLAM